MALTITEQDQGVFGDQRYWIGTVAFDSSYPTGGEALAASDIPGMSTSIRAVFVGAQSSLVPTKVVSWDPSTAKLVVNVEDGTTGISAEAANESDQSGVVDVQMLVLGY